MNSNLACFCYYFCVCLATGYCCKTDVALRRLFVFCVHEENHMNLACIYTHKAFCHSFHFCVIVGCVFSSFCGDSAFHRFLLKYHLYWRILVKSCFFLSWQNFRIKMFSKFCFYGDTQSHTNLSINQLQIGWSIRFCTEVLLYKLIKKMDSAQKDPSSRIWNSFGDSSPSIWFYGFHTPDKLPHKTTLGHPNQSKSVLLIG
jgi:hypothetical protein